MSPPDTLKDNIQNFNYEYHKRNRFWRLFKIVFFVILVTIIAISSFSYKVIFSQESVLSGLGRLPVIKQLRQFMGLENLHGELDDRINFVLLGQGGVGHEGPYLTDTIIFGSIKPSSHDVALISIPRDFFVDIPGYGWHKINETNSLGEVNHFPAGGSVFTAKVIAEVFDLPVHYWLRIDFEAFKQVIDELGGVEVCLDRSFEDTNYPTEDFKVQTISFTAGCQKMTGETALKFVRSRHGTNGEGSDFARAARQQKIILAVKDKILTLGTLTSPQKISHLYSALKNNIQTNLDWGDISHFLALAKNIKTENVTRRVLDNSPSGLLKADISADGSYILLPRTDNLDEIRNLAKNIFLIKNGHEWQPVNVIILNATKIEGLARDKAGYLSSLGFDILKTSNASTTEVYEKTVVYDLKNTSREDVIAVLKKSLDANVTDVLPEFLKKEVEGYESVDFLIVLGSKVYSEEEHSDDEKSQGENKK